MKRASSFLLSLFILSSSVITVGAQTTKVQVQINDQLQSFDQAPIIMNDFTLVPLRGIFESLGAKVKWEENSKKVIARKDNVEISLIIGSKTGLIDGKPVMLDIEARIVDGRTMVPLRFISEAFGAEVEWDSKTRTVLILTREGSTDSISEDSSSSTTNNTVLSYDKAIEMALNNSNDLKSAKIDIKKADKSLETASDAIDYIPSGGGNQQATSAFSNWTKAQTSYFMTQKQYEIKKETLEYNVRSTYNDILLKQEARKLAQLSLEDKELKKRITDIKRQNGMASEFEATQAKAAVQESKANLESASKALEDTYVKLNKYLGKNENDRYELLNKPIYQKSKSLDLETVVSQVVTSSSAVWLAEQQVDLAKLDVDYFTFSGTTNDINSFEHKQLDRDKAQFLAADTKRQIELAVRSLYYNIFQLEQQYEALQANILKAEEGLKLTQIKYDQGLSTSEEVFDSKLAVEQLHQQLFSITAQLDTLKIALTKPWVVSK